MPLIATTIGLDQRRARSLADTNLAPPRLASRIPAVGALLGRLRK